MKGPPLQNGIPVKKTLATVAALSATATLAYKLKGRRAQKLGPVVTTQFTGSTK